jgi:hypothetical protein
MKRTAATMRSRGAHILKLVGLHSGFLPCCIIFYVKTYEPLTSTVYEMRPHGETRDQLLARATPSQADALRKIERYRKQIDRTDCSFGYVPCPRCLRERKPVKVKRCDWHLTARERRRVLWP